MLGLPHTTVLANDMILSNNNLQCNKYSFIGYYCYRHAIHAEYPLVYYFKNLKIIIKIKIIAAIDLYQRHARHYTTASLLHFLPQCRIFHQLLCRRDHI